MEVKENMLFVLQSQYTDLIRLGLDTSKIETEIENLKWITEADEQKPPDFKNVLLTIVGFDEVVIGARWKNEWFLINDFKQKFKGDSGAVKVIAWRFLPEIYK